MLSSSIILVGCLIVRPQPLSQLPMAVVVGSPLPSLQTLWRCRCWVLPSSLRRRRQSSPSAELSELSLHDLRLSPVILHLLGEGQLAIAIVPIAIGDIRSCIVIVVVVVVVVALAIPLSLPQLRASTAPIAQ
jgi:hypothetical protein